MFGAMSKKTQNLGVPIGHGSLAVSDGELNMIMPEGCGSSHSLDSNPSPHQLSTVGKVASWAVSFERLLNDPNGVCYFTAFLKSEVSAENILFWQACEKFRQIQAHQKEELTREARSIFDSYLSDSAFHAVNIDETARITESDLQTPTPDMFHKAQQQIFKLMKFDSYARFIRSQLFQKCMVAEVENRPLPGLGPWSRNLGAMQNASSDRSFSSEIKNKVKSGKCSPLDMAVERKRAGQESRAAWDRGYQQRGSWEAKLSERTASGGQRGNLASIGMQGGSMEPLKMGVPVFPLGNKTVLLNSEKGKPHSSSPQVSVQGTTSQRRGAITSETVDGLPQIVSRNKPTARARNTAARKTYDMDGFSALLSRTQCYSVDDQRGLLRKEHLEMPSFLELPLEAGKEEEKKEESQVENRRSEEPRSTPTQSEQEGAVGVAATEGMDSDALCSSPLSRPDGSFICTDLSRETVV